MSGKQIREKGKDGREPTTPGHPSPEGLAGDRPAGGASLAGLGAQEAWGAQAALAEGPHGSLLRRTIDRSDLPGLCSPGTRRLLPSSCGNSPTQV